MQKEDTLHVQKQTYSGENEKKKTNPWTSHFTSRLLLG